MEMTLFGLTIKMRANENSDALQDQYDSSKDNVLSVSSYNLNRGSTDMHLQNSLYMQSLITSVSNSEAQCYGFPYSPLSQLSHYKKTDLLFLVEELGKVTPVCISNEEKLAFWINLYNTLIMHTYLVYGVPKSDVKLFALMQKVSYTVEGQSFSATDIEFVILKMKPPAHRP